MKAFQDRYPEEFSHCYGCGRNNPHGHQLKSYWNGDRTVARFLPKPHHIAVPGFVYGGLIASLIDCHGIGSAAAAHARAAGPDEEDMPLPRFVTASLKVDYLAPTPQGVELELEGDIVEIGKRKVIVDVTLQANVVQCARGRVIAVELPEKMLPFGGTAEPGT
jgi:acyl-coenzyme A thioesterase PaaI-like protein